MSHVQLDRLPRTVELVKDETGPVFRYIDERLLPGELRLEQTRDWQSVIEAIKTLAVRGAPAIGLAGAAAMALWAAYDGQDLQAAAAHIGSARPTAVNLQWAVDRVLAEVDGVGSADYASAMFDLVKRMEREDEETNRAIGANGAALLPADARVLTHCNAGSLATGFYGTALGVVYAAAEQGKIAHVYADETRPLGQGARLTTWELAQAGVPVTLICDNMAATVMAQGFVDAVIVGADRIAANGDSANKIGTYGLAILAHEHGIPFYVAAPSSSVDLTLPTGEGIPIELRDASEVLVQPIEGVEVLNPAFDVTPARYITRIITEQGVFSPGDWL